MAELSPAAQAVLDASSDAPVGEGWNADRLAIAAALQAAAYIVAPAVPSLDSCCDRRSAQLRHQLLAIAAELEGNQ